MMPALRKHLSDLESSVASMINERGGGNNTLFSQQFCIRPIKPRAGAGKYLDRVRQETYKLGVPSSHLATGAPKGTEYGTKVPPSPLLQRLYKLGAFSLGDGGTDYVKGLAELEVGVRIIFDGITYVEDSLSLLL